MWRSGGDPQSCSERSTSQIVKGKSKQFVFRLSEAFLSLAVGLPRWDADLEYPQIFSGNMVT